MIFLFTGDDSKNKLSSYEKFLKSIPTSMEVLFINRNEFNPTQIESFCYNSGLFSSLSTLVFQNIFEHEETRDFIFNKLELMQKSANSFVFLEGKLNKSIINPLEKVGAKINIFELSKEKKEKFDNFLVANAFEKKDKFNMWVHFQKAMDLGVGMEEIVGVLFWKIKDMILKKNFSKFSESELKDFASRLSYLLPQARKEGRDAQSVFEQFLLEIF